MIANFPSPGLPCSTKYRNHFIEKKQTLNSYCWIKDGNTSLKDIDYNYEEEEQNYMYAVY
jgi:hypothetical protein